MRQSERRTRRVGSAKETRRAGSVKEIRQASSAKRENQAKRVVLKRTIFLMMVCGVGLFAILFWKLWDIAVVQHERFQQLATAQQPLDLSVSARRGNIRDRNGNVMAMSATVYDLILSPRDLMNDLAPAKKFTKEDGTVDEAARNAETAQAQDKIIQDLMTMLPDLDRERLEKQVRDSSKAYKEIKTKIEEEDAEKIREYIVENKTSHYLYLVSGTRRYYPYAGLAAQTLGFVNSEGGAVGIEAAFNDELEGTAGRVLTTKTGAGVQMYNNYSEFIDAIDGYDLTLTIDATIQAYIEKTLEEGIKEYDVRNGAFGIAMNPKTGAIYGMASSPDFDPNNYSVIVSDLLKQQIDGNADAIYEKLKSSNEENLTEAELREKAKNQAYSDAVNTQWRSKVLDSRYQPGSTFKALVLAAALGEGVVKESDTFYCSGSYMIPGWGKPIHCSKRTGHGTQTLSQAVENSCNPAFMQIGQRLGLNTFYDYFEAFGMTEQTGIELPGEASLKGAHWNRGQMSNVDLAVASFGQRFEVNPLQMIAGFSAVINGGKLIKPYVVQTVTTKDGTVVRNTEPTVVRQVVSEESSRRATAILENVVALGTGSNAYVPGYRIGGKTGSSETNEKGRTIVSFMGFAPADDPEVIVLLAFDKPQEQSPGSNYSTTGVYISGGNMAAPKAGGLIAQILDYLGIEKKYTEKESALEVKTPYVVGAAVDAAKKTLQQKNLGVRIVGKGDVVARQVPASGVNIPAGSSVALYLGDAAPEKTGTVPNVVGLTYENARKRLEEAGFFMRANGVSVYYGNTTTATGQSIGEGETADTGTIINVQFANIVEDGWVNTDE